MSPPWWAAFPPTEATIRCGRREHRLRWQTGQLIPADHLDPEGELVRAALGGATAKCLTMAQAWSRHGDDLDVLVLAPRSPADELTLTLEFLEELRSIPFPLGFGQPLRARRLSRRPGGEKAERARVRWEELLSLLALGPAFQWRLSGTVAWAWSRNGSRARDQAAARPALAAALTGRLAPAAAAWLGIDPGQVSASLHEAPGWGDITIDGTSADSRLHASLPAGWLARVWAPGLTVTGGHFVLDVLDVAWPHARVLALPQPGAKPVVLGIRRDGEHWTIAGGGI